VVTGLLAPKTPDFFEPPSGDVEIALCKSHCGLNFEDPKIGFILGPSIKRILRAS
jgi:hypothetical protein